jgi:hypothetical protein
MKNKKISSIFRYTLLTTIVISAGVLSISCSEITQTENSTQSQLQETPIYLIDPIIISPLPVTTGQQTTFSMKIENAGNVTGNYQADLIINGINSDKQIVIVPAHSTSSLIFKNVFSSPGQYSIRIGPQKSTIQVSDSIDIKPVLTLKLDSGNVNGFDSLTGSTQHQYSAEPIIEGHMIQLTAPTEGFIISEVEIFGYLKDSSFDFNNNMVIGGPGLWVYSPEAATPGPARNSFTINVYDNKRTRLFSGDYNKQLFAHYPNWVTVNIGEIQVAGDFYIELLTYNQPQIYGSTIYNHDYWNRFVVHTWYYQLMIGYEDAINVHSYASEGGSIIPDRFFTHNWLIRAGGHPYK